MLEPANLYKVQTITKRTNTLKAVAHITGGSLTENLQINNSFHLRFYCPITQLPLYIHGLSIIASLNEAYENLQLWDWACNGFDCEKFEDTRNILESENIPFALIGKLSKKR